MNKNNIIYGERLVYIIIAAIICLMTALILINTDKKLDELSGAEAVVIHDVTLTSKEDRDKETVYITPSGNKYHLDGCSYLSENKIAVSKSEAKNSGYESCAKCQP